MPFPKELCFFYQVAPPELGLGKGMVCRLKRCIYGTRDAGALWEATYTHVLLQIKIKH